MTDQGDDELVDRYTRARVKGGVMVVEVAVVRWDGQRPKMSWVEHTHLLETVPSSITDAARRAALLDPDYFLVCRECRRRCLSGYTSDGVCRSCLAGKQGAVR